MLKPRPRLGGPASAAGSRRSPQELPAARQVLHATLQNYNAMQIGAFDVLRARQLELESERDLLMTQEQAWMARLDLAELKAGVLNRDRLGTQPSGPERGRRTPSMEAH